MPLWVRRGVTPQTPCSAALAEESIRSADDLRELTADDLKELGFKMGDRKRVLKWGATQ